MKATKIFAVVLFSALCSAPVWAAWPADFTCDFVQTNGLGFRITTHHGKWWKYWASVWTADFSSDSPANVDPKGNYKIIQKVENPDGTTTLIGAPSWDASSRGFELTLDVPNENDSTVGNIRANFYEGDGIEGRIICRAKETLLK